MSQVDPNLALESAIEKMVALCENYRDALLFSHFAYDGHQWQCDQASRFNVVGVILLAVLNEGQLPPNFIFRDMANVDHVVTGPYMINMGITMLAFLSAVYKAGWTHKANIQAMTDPIAVQEYDYMSTLWPSNSI
jgi:hypothetical protein